MPHRRLGGLIGVALAVGLAACVVPPPAPDPVETDEPWPAQCRPTPTGGESLGTTRYLESVFVDVAVVCDIEYGKAPDEHGNMQKLTMDVYAPFGDTASARPVVFWLTHGGFVQSVGEAVPHPEYASRLARRGYIVAVVEYRVREGSAFSYSPPFENADLLAAAADAQHDAQAAVRWYRQVAQNPDLRIDPERFVTVGISAGGMTALAVNYAEEDDVGTSGNPGASSCVRAAISLEGCAMNLDTIDAGDGPALLVHNTTDPVVAYSCAEVTRDDAIANGARAELDTRIDQSPTHGFTNYPSRAIDAVVQFLYDEVAPKP